MHDEYGEVRRLLAPLAGEPTRPSTVDMWRAMADGRRRLRRRRVGGVGAVAAVTALALAGVPMAVTAARGPAGEQPDAVAASDGASDGWSQRESTAGSADPQPAAAPPAPTRCDAQLLPVPDAATESYLTGADPTGRYLVGRAYDGDTGQAWGLLWDGGRLTVLDIPVDDPGNLVVNPSGTVAGGGFTRDDRGMRGLAWVYQDGRYAELPHGGDYSVVDINERGDVLGTDIVSGGELGPADGKVRPAAPDGPAIWPTGDRAALHELAVPDGAGWVTATGIDEDGTVVGTRQDPGPAVALSTDGPVGSAQASTDDPRQAYSLAGVVWAPDGTVSELPVPDGLGPDSSATDVRGGWVVGGVQDPARDPPADTVIGRWHLPSGEVSTGADLAWVSAINGHGWLAGHTRQASGVEHPALQLDDRVLELPEPPEAVPTLEGTTAVTISDDGRVAGGQVMVSGGLVEGEFTAGDTAAVRWTCH